MFKTAIQKIDYKNLTYKEAYTLWTFYEHARNIKLSDVKKKKNPFSNNYVTAFRKHTTPLHDKLMTEISLFDIQELIDDCPYGFTTRRYIKQLSKTLFAFCNSIFRNKFEYSFFKYITLGKKEKSQRHNAFTIEEKQKLWDLYYNRGSDINIDILEVILIGLYTTLRPTALLEITNKNVFIDNDYMVGGIKTIAGINREIPIHKDIKPLIEKRYNESNTYLLCNSDGNPYKLKYYQTEYKKIMTLIGLSHVPYDNRKTVSTELFNNKIDKLVVKHLMGHSIKDVTECYYIEISLEQKKEAINTLV